MGVILHTSAEWSVRESLQHHRFVSSIHFLAAHDVNGDYSVIGVVPPYHVGNNLYAIYLAILNATIYHLGD